MEATEDGGAVSRLPCYEAATSRGLAIGAFALNPDILSGELRRPDGWVEFGLDGRPASALDAAIMLSGPLGERVRGAVAVDGRDVSLGFEPALGSIVGVTATAPSEWCWVELSLPDTVASVARAAGARPVAGSVGGVLVRCVDLRPVEEAFVPGIFWSPPRGLGALAIDGLPRWFVSFAPMLLSSDGTRPLAMTTTRGMACFLGDDGGVLGNGSASSMFAANAIGGEESYREDTERTRFALWTDRLLVRFAVLTLGIVNARNVDLVERDLPASRQARRLAQRRGEPVRKFYTLAIKPGRRAVGDEDAGGGHRHADRSLHLCRGHFAHYTEARPLFGKHVGSFWVPAHVRGTPDVGVVGKDYRVDGSG